jgi:hypothetical protein
VATLAELAFPITGLLVNMLVINPPQAITVMQGAGIAVLWIALGVLDWVNARSPLGQRTALIAEPAS